MNWADVWARKQVESSGESLLAGLLAADGYDTPFGLLGERPWRDHVHGWATRLGIGANDSVFEVGCGAGAFLYVLAELGCRVAGLDISESLIAAAREVMPQAAFTVAEARDLDPSESYDFVISSGVFIYFPDLDYAADVLGRMVAKARRAVLVLDVPDLALRDAAIAERIAASGGEAAYRARYDGLDHLYLDQGWMAQRMAEAGLVDVGTAGQGIPGYTNGRYRFNAWGRVPPSGAGNER